MEGSAASEVRFRDLRTPEQVEALAPEWDALITSARRPSPYLLARRVASWLWEFGGEFDPCVTVADLQLAPDEVIATAERLLHPLAESGACALNAYGVPANSVLIRAAGSRLHAIPRAGAPVLEMPDGWEAAYQRRISKDRRSRDRRAERQLNKLGSLEITVARDAAGVEHAIGVALELHRLRWQGRPDGSSFGFAASGAAGARRVEFLGDADEYKGRYADRLDPMHQCVGLAHGLTGHLRVARVLGSVGARKRLKKYERLHRIYRSGGLTRRGDRAA